MSTTENTRPRLRPVLVVLLVIVTIANVSALVLAVAGWSGETTYDSGLVDYAMFSVLLAVAALVGIAGAWQRRSWGPPLYFATQALGFLFLLFAAPDAIGTLTFVPLVLAGLLWFLAG